MPDIPVVVLGHGAVGKSCIAIQYVQGHFVDKYDATIEDIFRKPAEIDGQPVVLSIVDTAGQDAFGEMRDRYMKRGQGFLLVYSISDQESFQQLKRIYARLQRAKDHNASIPCVVVGNKVDLAAQRAVSQDEGRLLAAHAKCPFVEISAKNREQVDELFKMLVRNIWEKQGGAAAGGSGGSGAAGGGGGGAAGASGSNGSAGASGQGGAAVGGSGNTKGGTANSNNGGGASSSSDGAMSATSQPQQKVKKGFSCTLV